MYPLLRSSSDVGGLYLPPTGIMSIMLYVWIWYSSTERLGLERADFLRRFGRPLASRESMRFLTRTAGERRGVLLRLRRDAGETERRALGEEAERRRGLVLALRVV